MLKFGIIIGLSPILEIALILCVFIPLFQCRVYIHVGRPHTCYGCGYGHGHHYDDSHYHDECGWFKDKVRNEENYAQSIINEFRPFVVAYEEKVIQEELKDYKDNRGDDKYKPHYIPLSDAELMKLSEIEKDYHRQKLEDEKERKEAADKKAREDRRKVKEEEVKKNISKILAP